MVDFSIILAAGKGTRFKSHLPKVLHTVLGRTMLEGAVRAVAPWTQKKVIVVAGFGLDQVRKECEEISRKLDVNLEIVHQEEQLGTGHAADVACAAISENSGKVLVVPGDSPLLSSESLEAFLLDSKEHKLSVLSAVHPSPFGFGRVIRDSNGNTQRIVEEKDASESERAIQEVNTSIYAGDLAVFKSLLPKIKSENKQKEYYLTDIVSLMIESGDAVRAFVAEDFTPYAGSNTRRELQVLEATAREQQLNALMDSGVTVQNPSNTFIDADAVIESDVFIGSGTRIYGNSHIASGAIIEGDCLIRDSKIEGCTLLRLGSYVDQSEIGKGVTMGPYAQIRPGSQLGDGVRIGNFVEVKNSNLAAGVKANHLAYLGDIDVGEDSNVGAGTIVCNYDGEKKHRSVIGKNSFIGSNSTLISPVNIGSGAYVAAASAVNKNVPDETLAIARGRQENKDGWVKRRNKSK